MNGVKYLYLFSRYFALVVQTYVMSNITLAATTDWPTCFNHSTSFFISQFYPLARPPVSSKVCDVWFMVLLVCCVVQLLVLDAVLMLQRAYFTFSSFSKPDRRDQSTRSTRLGTIRSYIFSRYCSANFRSASLCGPVKQASMRFVVCRGHFMVELLSGTHEHSLRMLEVNADCISSTADTG